MNLICEIFTDKKQENENFDIATGAEDVPELETEKEVEERQRVNQRQKQAEEKHIKNQQTPPRMITTIRNTNTTKRTISKRIKNNDAKSLITRLPILLSQVKAGNNSQKLTNEIRQLIYSLYRSKNLSKTLYNHLINGI